MPARLFYLTSEKWSPKISNISISGYLAVCRPLQRHGTGCEGCQYAAWSPDSQFLAVSSDSHAAVAVWRVQLRDAAALEPDALGNTLFDQLCECTPAQKNRLKAMLPVGLWSQVEEGMAASATGTRACTSGEGAATSSGKKQQQQQPPQAQPQQQDKQKEGAGASGSNQDVEDAAPDSTQVLVF